MLTMPALWNSILSKIWMAATESAFRPSRPVFLFLHALDWEAKYIDLINNIYPQEL